MLYGYSFIILLITKNCGKKSALPFSRHIIFNSSIIFNRKKSNFKNGIFKANSVLEKKTEFVIFLF